MLTSVSFRPDLDDPDQSPSITAGGGMSVWPSKLRLPQQGGDVKNQSDSAVAEYRGTGHSRDALKKFAHRLDYNLALTIERVDCEAGQPIGMLDHDDIAAWQPRTGQTERILHVHVGQRLAS